MGSISGVPSLAGLLICLLAPAALLAQTPGQSSNEAQQVQIAVPFGVVSGQLVTSGNDLIFVDSQHVENSFAISRSAIRNGSVQNGTLTLDLSQPATIKGGQPQSRLNVRFNEPAAAQDVVNWIHTTQPTAQTDGATAQPGTLSYNVKHDHFMGSDNGRLMITPTQIIYESVTDVNSSRQWKLSDIKSVSHDGPYKLKVEPFSGDQYNFALLGRGISPDDYNTIVKRVTNARVAH